MDKKFLHKVVDQLVSETRISKRRAITLILTPFSQKTFSAFDFSQGKDLHTKYSDVSVLFFYFNLHCKDVYSLDDTEISYVFSKYRSMVMLKINGINESRNIDGEWHYQYVFDDKYLSRVLEQLLSETKIEWDTSEENESIKVAWDPYIGYQRDVSWPLFQRHCKEIYSLNDIEISDLWVLYRMEIRKRLNQED